jgi:hypothetical protein
MGAPNLQIPVCFEPSLHQLDPVHRWVKTGKEGLQCTAVLHIVLLILYRQVTAVVRERTSGDRGEIVQ